MSHRRQGWTSADRVERRDTLRSAIRELGARHDVSEAEVGRRAGYASPGRWAKVMRKGELACPAAADLLLISSVLGREHELFEEMARAAGFRLVPEAAAAQSETQVDAAASAALRDLAQLVSRLMGTAGGMTPSRAAEIGADLDEVRRSLGKLEAAVSYAVVERPLALMKVAPR